MEPEWFFVQSWHIVDRAAGRSHCGLELGVRTLVAQPPAGDKTCETCLRHVVREEQPAPESKRSGRAKA